MMNKNVQDILEILTCEHEFIGREAILSNEDLSSFRQITFGGGMEGLPAISVRLSGEGIYEVTLSEIKQQNFKRQLKNLSVG
ncbi:MAG: hypothetical protein ACK4SX_08400 [Alcanivoracaceae bacterium]